MGKPFLAFQGVWQNSFSFICQGNNSKLFTSFCPLWMLKINIFGWWDWFQNVPGICINENQIIDIINCITLVAPILILIWGIRSILRIEVIQLSELNEVQYGIFATLITIRYLKYLLSYCSFVEGLNDCEKRFASLITQKPSYNSFLSENWKWIHQTYKKIKEEI